jgi:hypothetical protein
MRAALFIALLAGCPSLPTPAELEEPQILALVADPPCASAAPSTLSALVAGPAGTIDPDAIAWSLPPGSRATLASAGNGSATVVAASSAAVGDEIEVDVAIATGGVELAGYRSLPVGTGCADPAIDAVVVDGVARPAGDTIELTAGARVTLDVSIAGGVADDAIVAWYSTAGTIDLYRHAPTQLVVGATPGAAVLYVVYRDGAGTAWREHAVAISTSGS